MPLLTENEKQYGLKETLIINHNFEERNPKMIDVNVFKIFHMKQVEKNYKEKFSALCNQVVINPSTVSHVLSNNPSAKFFELVRKTLSFCKFGDFYNIEENKQTQERDRDRYEVGKIHLSDRAFSVLHLIF